MVSINKNNILLLLILGVASLTVVMSHGQPGDPPPAQPQQPTPPAQPQQPTPPAQPQQQTPPAQPQQPTPPSQPQQQTPPSQPQQPTQPAQPADGEIADMPQLPDMQLKPLPMPGMGGGTSIEPFGKMMCAATPDPNFCETLARGSQTAIQATSRAISITIIVAKRMQPIIQNFITSLPIDVPPQLKNTCLETCNKDYQDLLQKFLGGMDLLYNQNIASLSVKISGIPMQNCMKSLTGVTSNSMIVQSAIKELSKYCLFTKLLVDHLQKQA